LRISKPPARLTRLALLALALGIGLAIGSVGIQRTGPERGAVSFTCGPAADEPCYGSLLNGGFPLGFLYDIPTEAGRGRLGMEDHFRPLPFLANIAFFFGLLAIVWRYGQARRRRMGDMMPRHRRDRP
jgi:hypothetical protein